MEMTVKCEMWAIIIFADDKTRMELLSHGERIKECPSLTLTRNMKIHVKRKCDEYKLVYLKPIA
jgi:hypothetical protein